MKLLKLNLLFIAFFVFALMSCDRKYPDDGFFKVGEKTYYVNAADLYNVGYEDGYYQLRLTLDNSNNNEPHSINFLFYSEVDEYLPSGNYTPYLYDGNYNHKFKRGAWMEESVSDVESGVILQGKVKVTKNNETYTIRIDCKDHNDNIVSGEYKGEIFVRN